MVMSHESTNYQLCFYCSSKQHHDYDPNGNEADRELVREYWGRGRLTLCHDPKTKENSVLTTRRAQIITTDIKTLLIPPWSQPTTGKDWWTGATDYLTFADSPERQCGIGNGEIGWSLPPPYPCPSITRADTLLHGNAMRFSGERYALITLNSPNQMISLTAMMPWWSLPSQSQIVLQ